MYASTSSGRGPTRRTFLGLLAGGAAIGLAGGYAISQEKTPENINRRNALNGSVSASLARMTVYCATLGEIYSLHADTGAVRWTRPLNSSEVLAVDRRGVYVAGGYDHSVYCLDPVTGAIRWTTRIGKYGDLDPNSWEYPSPSVDGNLVYIAPGGGYIYAIDAATGRLRWRQHAASDAYGQVPVVHRGIVYVGSPDSYVYALDALSGEFRWRFGSGSQSRQVGAQGVLTIVQGKLFAEGADHLYALTLESGKVVGEYPPAMPCTNGIVYTSTADGSLQAKELATSKILWKHGVKEVQWSPPAIGGNVLYLGVANMSLCCSSDVTRDWIGKVMALDAATGRPIWSYAVPQSSFTVPVVTDGIVFISDTYNLYALNVSTGEPRWIYSISNPNSFGQPVVTSSP
jgi:outer membrane protein assembly factor BamB